MSKVTYRLADGSASTIEVPVGWSLMEAAMQNSIEGIPAECGGGCACATCHVYVEEDDETLCLSYVRKKVKQTFSKPSRGSRRSSRARTRLNYVER